MDREVAAVAQLWLIGGPNGAGKTTLARNVLDGLGLPPTTAILNPDSITRAIDQVLPNISRWVSRVPRYGRRFVNWAAVVAVEAIVHASIESANDACVETVLSTEKYLKHVMAARTRGLRTGLIFVALPRAEDHVRRVQARVESGGHDVPVDKIRSRWEGAHRQLTIFADQVDHLLVFANVKLGTPELIIERLDGTLQFAEWDRLPRVTQALSHLR